MANLTLPIRLDPASPPDKTLHVTASGLPVRIYATDGGGHRPIHGAVYKDGRWSPLSWNADGKYLSDEDEDYSHPRDLRDRAPVKRGVWVAWFADDEGNNFFRSYATQAEAETAEHKWAPLHGVTYLKEGDGLTPADPPLWVDWAKLPEWAEWAAATEKGLVRYYARRPNRGEGTWMTDSSCVALPSHLYRLAPGFDWRDTLIQRREGV